MQDSHQLQVAKYSPIADLFCIVFPSVCNLGDTYIYKSLWFIYKREQESSLQTMKTSQKSADIETCSTWSQVYAMVFSIESFHGKLSVSSSLLRSAPLLALLKLETWEDSSSFFSSGYRKKPSPSPFLHPPPNQLKNMNQRKWHFRIHFYDSKCTFGRT